MKRFMGSFVYLLLVVQLAFAIDLPTPPPDFTWQEIPELKAALLKPAGWYFKREESKGTLAYFITKENIDESGEFRTGLTLNVFRKLKKSSALEQGKSMIERRAAETHAEIWTREVGPLLEFGCLAKVSDASGTSTTHNLAVVNQKTNTLYLFIFESPESDWEAAWKIGEKVMDTLALDDEI